MTAVVFLFTFGFFAYSGVFQNFLRESVGVRELGMGSLESLREVPGLLAALTAGTLVSLAEARVAGLGLAVCGVGIAATGLFPSFAPQVAVAMAWSVGFHLYATVSGALTLALAKGTEGGRHLGRMNGVGAMATIAALGASYVVARAVPGTPYSVYFVSGGVAIVVAAGLCFRLSDQATHGKRQPIVFRREYGLYYLLIFLEGCRRQIFSIFASFALILVYGVRVETMLLLQFVNAALIAVTAPAMGRWIDKVGERRPLTIYALGLIAVFVGYATAKQVGVLYALFLLDNVLFSFSTGFTVYLHRIVWPGELTPSLAMGVTMNHIAAVTVPLGGAWLWHHFRDYQAPFWVGVGIAVVSLVATRFLPEGTRAASGAARA